jgi:uncharacterized protein (UPF0332 family)
MLDPNHLIQLSEKLVRTTGAGAPRQAVLRRAVSTAYYAVFHALCAQTAETFVPANNRKSRAIFYRSLDHNKTRSRCKELGKSTLDTPLKNFFAVAAFSGDLRTFANNFALLQDLRHRCDYDPDYRLSKSEAEQAIDDASQAISCLEAADPDECNGFLAYLLFGARQL